MTSPTSPPRHADVPLLYNPQSDEHEASPLVTPSEEEMARYLNRQLAAATTTTTAVPAAPVHSVRQHEVVISSSADELPMPPVPARQAPAKPPVPATPSPAVPRTPRAAASTSTPGAEAAAPQIPPALKQIGRFNALKRQGRTEAGTLYRATDPRTGREVALHVLQGTACDSDKLRALLVQQLQAAARLSHPNIAPINEVDVDNGQPFLVLPAVDAETLPQRLQTQGPLPVHDAVLLGLQLARALAHAHQHGMLHRDLKPSNVLLLSGGKELQLAGFGIAPTADKPGDPPALGPANAARQYLTPEQTRGEPQDARSDVFSAGVVLYEMLAGERPFRGSTPLALAARIANEEPSPLQRVRPDAPPALRRVVERCLAKSPAQRYASAQDLADALLRVLADLETAQLQSARPTGLSLRTRWAVIAGMAAVVLVGAAAAAAAWWQLDAIRAQADEQGRGLARFAAAQHAEQVLAEDWVTLAAQLLPAVTALGAEQVHVVDAGGIVRVAGQQAQVGQAFSTEGVARTPARPDGTLVRDHGTRLDFEAPIQLQGKTLGRLVVGLPAPALMQAAQATAWLFALVAAAAGLVAAVVAYGLSRRLEHPIASAAEALAQIGQGRFDQRMPPAGSDAFGRLFSAIDAAAVALQRREAGQGKLR